MRVWTQVYQRNQLCCLHVIKGILKNDDLTCTTPLHIHTRVPITWHKLFLPLEIIFLMWSSRPSWKYPRPHLHQSCSHEVRGIVARNSSNICRRSVSFIHIQILWNPDAIFLKKVSKKHENVYQDSRWPVRDSNRGRSEREKCYPLNSTMWAWGTVGWTLTENEGSLNV